MKVNEIKALECLQTEDQVLCIGGLGLLIHGKITVDGICLSYHWGPKSPSLLLP
jgi:hypothetical protein